MDAVPRDISSLEAGVATDMRGEEEGPSADLDEGADDGNKSVPLLYNVPKKKIPKRVEAPSPKKRTINIREEHEQQYDNGYDSDGEKGPFWNAT